MKQNYRTLARAAGAFGIAFGGSAFGQIAAPGATTPGATTPTLTAGDLQAASQARAGLAGLLGGGEGYTMTGGLGLVLTTGNSETLLFNGEFTAERKWENNEFALIADFIYGETGSTTTNQYFHLGAKYNKLISDTYYYGVLVDAVHDDIAELDYRVSIFPYLGYQLWSNDRATLSIELGPGWTMEDQSGNSDAYASARVAQLFDYQISERSKFWQKAEWSPEIANVGDNFLVNYEVGVTTQLSDNWSLKTFARGVYDSEVPEGIDDTDFGIFTTLSYGFVGDEETTLEDLADSQASLGTNSEWQSTALVGVTISQGNSETVLANANVLSAREWGPNLLGLSLGYTYGEADSEVTAESYTAGANYRRTIQDPYYLGIGATFLRDDFSAVDYRITVTPSLGMYVIKNDTTTLNIETGPAYVFESVDDIENDYAAFRVAQGLEHQFNDTFRIWESVEYLADFQDFGDNYLLNFEVGFETKLSDRLSLNTYLQGVYDPSPAAGFVETDLRLVSALSINF